MARDGGGLSKVLCDVVAFANTCGGTVYIGVSPNQGPVKGVEAPDLAVQQIRKEIERNVTPPLECQVDLMHSQGAAVLRVQTPNGSDKPYALGQTRVYIREEGETNEAVRDELVQLVLQGRKLAEPTLAPVEAAPAPLPQVAQPEPEAEKRGVPARASRRGVPPLRLQPRRLLPPHLLRRRPLRQNPGCRRPSKKRKRSRCPASASSWSRWKSARAAAISPSATCVTATSCRT